jgi:hypothetical protein
LCPGYDLLVFFSVFLPILKAQTVEPGLETERPVPILTGNAFTNVDGGNLNWFRPSRPFCWSR